MIDDDRMNLGDAIVKGMRLLAALLELVEMEVEQARELRAIEELDKAEWLLHCEQYGGEDLGSQACYDLFFALDWE
tara:strand:- start:55 stop:282 length:228 start_codon:yes stop_codon:yes gene_type:complete